MQRVEIGVFERFVVVRHRHHGILFIRPSAVVVHGNGDGVAFHAERFFQKRIGANAVHIRAAFCGYGEGFRIGGGIAGGHHGQAARNGERLNQVARGGFPQPVAHLVVEGFHFARLDNMDVVTQAVINLRAVGLCVNRLHFHAFDIGGIFRAVCFRAGVHAFVTLPNAGQRGQRAQMGERVAVGIAFGVDVFRVGMRFQVHLRSLILLDKILSDGKKAACTFRCRYRE